MFHLYRALFCLLNSTSYVYCSAHLEGFMLDDKSVFGLLRKETLALKKQFAKPRYTPHSTSLPSFLYPLSTERYLNTIYRGTAHTNSPH